MAHSPNPLNVLQIEAVRQAAQIAFSVKTAHVRPRDLTAEVLEAFGSAVVGNAEGVKVASLASKLKQLQDMFSAVPQRWADFKKMLGVKGDSWLAAARELPGKIRAWIKDGEGWLKAAGQHLVEKVPLLKLYFDVGVKLPSLNDWIMKMAEQLPEPIKRGLAAITTRAKSLAHWIDELLKQYRVLKPAGMVVSGAIFGYIWLNVTEISWDIPEIIRGFLGGYSFVELLHSLPESAVGFLISAMFPGIPGGLVWNAILPITVALRLFYLIQKDVIHWSPGRSLEVDWVALGLEAPTGIPPFIRV